MKPVIVTHRTLADPKRVPEYNATCPPTSRSVVVAVRADGGPNLPITFLGREVARTDTSGAAHVLLTMKPDEQFDLTIQTASNELLRPQSPTATFRAHGRDELFTFDAHFAQAAAPRHHHAPAAPKPTGPIRVTENVTPPVSLSQPAPAYPAAAKAAGVEGTVIVKYAVGADGSVTVAKAVRGPQELRAACEAAVKSWRFKPAMLDGAAVSVWRIARFPFRIKT